MTRRTTGASRITEVRAALADRYAIKHALGKGGMATVFLAERLTDGAAVAVKVLNREYAVSILADRFLNEIAFLAELEHPNILPVLDSAQAGRTLYYVMPYAQEGSLGDRIRGQPALPRDEVGSIARQVAAALDYAHAKNIVHRDIKPGNILFDAGRISICDFGIARAVVEAGTDRLSTSGLVVGTPSYMSPEQAAGQPVGVRSDVYSLGCVVYEMLAGEPPFTGRTTQIIIARQLHEQPPSLRVVRPDIPAAVEDAIMQALAKAPRNRPPSAGRFVERLTAA